MPDKAYTLTLEHWAGFFCHTNFEPGWMKPHLINMKRQGISLAVYSLLQNSQPTITSVDISFSMLKKLLAMDRNF